MKKADDAPYLFIEPVMRGKSGGIVNVQLNGNSPELVDVIATAMQTNINLALVISYANREYMRRAGRPHQDKPTTIIQLKLF
jgi:hypothetical protein